MQGLSTQCELVMQVFVAHMMLNLFHTCMCLIRLFLNWMNEVSSHGFPTSQLKDIGVFRIGPKSLHRRKVPEKPGWGKRMQSTTRWLSSLVTWQHIHKPVRPPLAVLSVAAGACLLVLLDVLASEVLELLVDWGLVGVPSEETVWVESVRLAPSSSLYMAEICGCAGLLALLGFFTASIRWLPVLTECE